jgi:hypothetical protein
MSSIAGHWWHMPLISALRRQRQADFWVWGQPGLQSEFQDSTGLHRETLSRKTKKKKKKNNSLCFCFCYKDLFIVISKYCSCLRHTRRGHQISLQMVVRHHVVAGIWTQDLRRAVLTAEPSLQPWNSLCNLARPQTCFCIPSTGIKRLHHHHPAEYFSWNLFYLCVCVCVRTHTHMHKHAFA